MVMAKRKVNVEELRKYGFSEKEIEEALEREKRGLHEVEPSPDLVAKTLKHARKWLKNQKNKALMIKRLKRKSHSKP